MDDINFKPFNSVMFECDSPEFSLRMMKKYFTTALLLLAMVSSYGQKAITDVFKVKSIKEFAEWFDRYTLGNSDTAYISLPKERFFANANFLLSGFHNKVVTDIPKENFYLDYSMKSELCYKWSVGASFRSLGASYSHNIVGSYDNNLTFSAYGNIVGGEIQWLSYKDVPATIHLKTDDTDLTLDLNDDNCKRSEARKFIMNLYYVLNHKKFSYKAAFSQTLHQKKSCGSFVIGATYIHTQIFTENLTLTDVDSGVPSVKYTVNDVALGVCYAYNFVCCKQRLLIHISAMPMVKYAMNSKIGSLDAYESGNYIEFLNEEIEEFNKKHIDIRPSFVGRVSASYARGRYVFGFQGVFNYFWSGSDKGLTLSTSTWHSRIYLGVRF